MNTPSYKLIAILFGIGVTLHNLEEAMFLVRWYGIHLRLRFTPNAKIYWVVTSLVSVAIWIPIVAVCVRPDSTRFQWALAGFALVMAVNAVIPHLVWTVATRSYSPGTGTGMLLNLPLGTWLIHKQWSAHMLTNIWRQAVPFSMLLVIGAFAILFGAHAIRGWKRQSRLSR
ncbi:MAG TPA: HXXEE domain-containing protein [Candidatus Eremiobacteraceae bacterium]|nr:HXXEE domain-containing protein [Candidatus Eremiobacteraceae bacterium]